MPSSFLRAVIATVLYADIFDYPLNFSEIRRFLIAKECRKDDLKKLEQILDNSESIQKSGGFYFLRGKKNSVHKRLERNRFSKLKLKAAKKWAGALAKIPFIKLIAVSGAVAAANADRDDDIDLFIITNPKRVWLTRFLCVFLLRFLGKYRLPGESKFNDKFCLNMYLDEDNLTIPKNEQDLYSARELAQLLPLYNKEETFEKFVGANLWVKKFLPNSFDWQKFKHNVPGKKNPPNSPGFNLFTYLNKFAGSLQKKYMSKRQTSEVIREGYLRFHPQDQRIRILSAFKERGRSLNLRF